MHVVPYLVEVKKSKGSTVNYLCLSGYLPVLVVPYLGEVKMKILKNVSYLCFGTMSRSTMYAKG